MAPVVPALADAQSWPPPRDSAAAVAVDADSVTPPVTIADMLSGRVPGITATWANGLTGTGAGLRIRSVNSFFAPGTPLLVIDGIAANGEEIISPFARTRVTSSRLDDLDPFFIERVEVLRGPAAAALYGSGAAAGVLRVTTYRGAPGPPRWRAYAEGAATPLDVTFPDNMAAPGRITSSGAAISTCPLFSVASGTCTQDSIIRWNPLERVSPFRSGSAQRAGVSVGGGVGGTTFFGGVSGDNATGLSRESDRRRLRLDASAGHTFGRRIEAGVHLGYLRDRLGLAPSEIIGYGLFGRARDDSLRGYLWSTPDQEYAGSDWSQRTSRLLMGATVTWRAFRWLELGALAGSDRTDVEDRSWRTIPVIFGSFANEIRNEQSADIADRRRTLRLTADVRHRVRGLESRTTLSVDERRDRLQESTRDLLSGGNLDPGVAYGDWTESTMPFTIRGLSVGEHLTRRELALDLGLRFERAGLDDRPHVTRSYPSAELAWTVSRTRLARFAPALSALRLSGGFGEAGEYRSDQRNSRTNALLAAPPGTPIAQPERERTREIEVGAAVAALDDRVRLTLGRYSRHTRDALLLGDGSASMGYPPLLMSGGVSSSGIEATLEGRVATLGRAHWSAALSAATNRNRVESLAAPQMARVGQGVLQLFRNGYPLGGFWGSSYTYADANGDGLLDRTELVFADALRYLGSPTPTRALSLRNEITFGPRYVMRIRIEHLGGHKRVNLVALSRCGTARCSAAVDPATPLAKQAEVIATAEAAGYSAAYLEDASFTKLRELSLSVQAPRAWARAISGDRLTFTVGGHDLLTRSSYRGLDPEVNTARNREYGSADRGELPRLPTYSARIDVAW